MRTDLCCNSATRPTTEHDDIREQRRRVPRPQGRRRWTSFVADPEPSGRPVRSLHEESNPRHRLRVEHDDHTLLIHLSGENGDGWTTIAVDRDTRVCSIADGRRQIDTARDAYDRLYAP